MKFNKIYVKKTFCVLASSFIILSMTGCSKNTENIQNDNVIIEYKINNTETIIEYTDNDMKVINELNKLETKLNELLNSKTIINVKDTAKEVFITTVDFIFYNGKIEGITFDELSNKGKEKVLNIASSIDNKSENKFPNYKETVSSKTNDILIKASESIEKSKTNIKDFSKDKLGDEYNEFIEAKNEVINSAKENLDTIIDIGKDTYDKGKEHIKNWYKEFKR